jgi:hypothetical protein
MTQAYMSDDHVLEVGRQWADAELRGDADELSSLLDADFMCVGPLGFLLDKQQYVAARRSGDLKHEAFDWQDVRVRVYGDAAVAIGTQAQKTTFQGRDVSGPFRVTQVLVRKGDRWLIASIHLSPIGQPPPWTGGAR